jgi:hypothetical protein
LAKPCFSSLENCQNRIKGVFAKQSFGQKICPYKQSLKYLTQNKTKRVYPRHWFNQELYQKSRFDPKTKPKQMFKVKQNQS